MTIPNKAAAFMERIAADDSHGYDQASRWGNPDYDCSWLVISAYKAAGVPLGCTYTGNMRADMLAHGFSDVTESVDLSTGAGLRRGDVLLNECHHTAMYVGGGMLVHARGNELGGVTGGQSGDQTGHEICKQAYFNYGGGWDCVLRYTGEADTGDGGCDGDACPIDDSLNPDTYTVQKGDYLGLIAARFGTTIAELARLNGIENPNLIFAGQVLLLRQPDPQEIPVGPDEPRTYTVKYGDCLSTIAFRELGDWMRWQELYSLNKLNCTVIYPGQVLLLPEK